MKKLLAVLVSAIMLAAVGMTSLSAAEAGSNGTLFNSNDLGAGQRTRKRTSARTRRRNARTTNPQNSLVDMIVNKSSYELGDRTLQRGSEGTDVMELQELLNRLGYFVGNFGVDKDGVDGKYGSRTADAVKLLQGSLGTTPTGRYSEATHKILKALLEANGIDYDAEKEKESDEFLSSLGLQRINKSGSVGENVEKKVQRAEIKNSADDNKAAAKGNSDGNKPAGKQAVIK